MQHMPSPLPSEGPLQKVPSPQPSEGTFQKVPSKGKRRTLSNVLRGKELPAQAGESEDGPMLNFVPGGLSLRTTRTSASRQGSDSSGSSSSSTSIPTRSESAKKRRGSFGIRAKGPTPDTKPHRYVPEFCELTMSLRTDLESGLCGFAFRKKGMEWRVHTLLLEDISQSLVVREWSQDEEKPNAKIVPITCKLATKYRHGYAMLILQDPVSRPFVLGRTCFCVALICPGHPQHTQVSF